MFFADSPSIADNLIANVACRVSVDDTTEVDVGHRPVTQNDGRCPRDCKRVRVVHS